MIKTQTDGAPVQGSRQTLQCDGAEGRTSINWFKDGNPLSTVANKYTLLRNGQKLRIENLAKSDSGLYQCGVIKPHGDRDGFQLEVHCEYYQLIDN